VPWKESHSRTIAKIGKAVLITALVLVGITYMKTADTDPKSPAVKWRIPQAAAQAPDPQKGAQKEIWSHR